MLVELNKKDLNFETSAPMTVAGLATESSLITTLDFEGFAGFNERYVVPLFDLLYKAQSSTTDIYKIIRVVGNLHNDESLHEADFYILKNIKDTMFLFKSLKSFSITLPDLRLGYESKDGKEVLYLDKKILRVMKTLDDNQKQELVCYYYCLAKFFKAFNLVKPHVSVDLNARLVIPEQELTALYTAYGKFPDTVTIDCIQLKEDVYFGDILYVNSPYSSFPKSDIDLKFSSTFVYNVFKTETAERLCIINTNTKEYFVIDMDNSTIYTNNELREFNTFDGMEWIPYLVTNIRKVKPDSAYYRVKFLQLDTLLSTSAKELTITNDASKFEALLELYPQITENNNMKYYDGYFKGCKVTNENGLVSFAEYYAKDEYAQQLYKQVQPYYETFDLKDLTGTVKGVAKGLIYSMLFEGESGTGKSTAARVIASRCGIPFVAINCSTNIEESDIFGTMIPNPEKSSADDPEFIWKDGPLTKAIRNGYVGIIEELNFGRPGVLGKLNSLLDEARQIDLPNGEVLKAHPNFRIIATANIGYEGTNRLNKALVNRFEICHKFTDLDEKEAKAVIVARTGYTDINKINKVFDIYRAIKKYSNEQNLSLVVSIRQLLNVFIQGKYYKNVKDAINNLILNQAFLEEPDHLKHFTDTVLNVFDLSFKL